MIFRAYHRNKVIKSVKSAISQLLEGTECAAASKAVDVALLRLSANDTGRRRLNRYLDLPRELGVSHDDSAVSVIDLAISELKLIRGSDGIDGIEVIIHSLIDVLDYTIARRGVIIQSENGTYRDSKADIALDGYFRGRRA